MTELKIDRLGARGDGIADTADGPVYVPFALPGEDVSVRLGKPRGDGRVASLQRVISPSSERANAACRHFGERANACGGCVAQHMGSETYSRWKRDIVVDALARHDLHPVVEPVVSVPTGSRRRVRLAFRGTAGGVILGFREGRSNRIVDIAECPVASPEITALMPCLREFLAGHPGQGEIAVTQTPEGVDVVVFASQEPDLDLRMDAPAFCEKSAVARLSWSVKDDLAPEPVLTLAAPTASFGGKEVRLPADSFLQPTEQGEAILRDRVLEGVGDVAIVADLYAGCGAFSLPMAAAGKTVTAYEGIAGQVTALRNASAGLSLTAEVRDLARQPLRAEELTPFDVVVLDPPRAGAAPQVAQIAGSTVAKIVYVSCNPATFARDARSLVDGGYTLGSVLPVDQFLWSPHVELAAIFQR